jgi:diguanylate cyclase (GGDEF)-like protein
VHFWLIVGAIIISALMFYSTYHLSTSFRSLTETSEQQIELRKAARELMDASDYLTENVQRFTVLGDRQFLDEYFKEAFETKRREDAISKMSAGIGNAAALGELQGAMDGSLELMDLEYYAMRLVIEAQGYADYPDFLRDVELSEEDKALSQAEKMQRASVMVHDDKYYEQKNRIREDMGDSLDELEFMAYDTDASALSSLGKEMALVRLVIALQTIGILIMVWLTTRLGIHPVLNAVDQIKADSPIPEVGAEEFRYLARAYNKMYEIYKNSLERLNFKASHDELTGAYNRSGYDLLLSSVDLENVYMLLFDIDNFKEINDTYGHAVGDKVLIKLVSVLKRYFRSDDYVCRIGGDEFVVFMVHAAKPQQQQIEEKITGINRELANTEDGLPSASVSVGIVHGSESSDAEDLFRKIDDAMYQAKQRGKNTYSFYKK